MLGKIIERKEVTVAKVRTELRKVTGKNLAQKNAYDYVSKFAKLDKNQAKSLKTDLEAAGIPRIKDAHINKLADIMPSTTDELKAIFQKEELALGKEDLSKILEILKKYR
ncbi:MAG: hypothetical protein GOU99_03535 [Candidatus Altiarchaeota archaeon]|nr:hypothetical protein [Candidatus Altiarchaeota archaeon]